MTFKLLTFSILILSTISFSEIIELEEKRADMAAKIKVFCIDGLKFVTTYSVKNAHYGPLIQMYEEKNGQVVPVRCDGNEVGIDERESSAKKK